MTSEEVGWGGHRQLTETFSERKPHFQTTCLVEPAQSLPYEKPHSHLSESRGREKLEN